MDPVREALYAHLAATAELTDLLSSPDAIYHRRAPADAVFPFVVFDRNSGTPEWTWQARLENDVWLVKAIARGPSATPAEDAAAAIDAALNDAQLAVAGRTLLHVRRTSTVDFGEDDGGDTIHHRGGLYRVVTQP